MSNWLKIPILLAILIFANCASSYCLRALDMGAKSIEYYDGEMYQISKGRNATIALTLKKQDSRYMEFLIGIINTSGESFIVSSQMLSGRYTSYNKEYALKVYTDIEWLKKLQNAQMAAAIAQGISQGLEASNAGRTTTNVTASAYGSDGSYAYGYGTATTYDYSKQAAVGRQHQLERDEMNQRFQSDMQNIRGRLIKTNTLHPGQNISGVVMAKYNYSDRIDIAVNCAGEEHLFAFNITSGMCEEKPQQLNEQSNRFNDKIASAKNYLNENNFLYAVQALDEALSINPQSTLAYYLRGSANLKLHNYQRAFFDLDKAIGTFSKPDASLLNGRGWVSLWLGNWEDARADFQDAIRLQDTAPAPYFNMCDYFWASKQDKDSALLFLEQGCQRANAEYFFNALYDKNEDGHFLIGLNNLSEFDDIVYKYRKKNVERALE